MVASLHTQLDEKKKEAEQREKLFQSLTLETENLKNRLASVTERCQALEKRDPAAQVTEATSWKFVIFVGVALVSEAKGDMSNFTLLLSERTQMVVQLLCRILCLADGPVFRNWCRRLTGKQCLMRDSSFESVS